MCIPAHILLVICVSPVGIHKTLKPSNQALRRLQQWRQSTNKIPAKKRHSVCSKALMGCNNKKLSATQMITSLQITRKKDAYMYSPLRSKRTAIVLSCQAWTLDHGAWTSRFHSSVRRVHAIQTQSRQPISCLDDCYVNNALLASAPVFTCTQSVNLLSKAFTSFLSRDSPKSCDLSEND